MHRGKAEKPWLTFRCRTTRRASSPAWALATPSTASARWSSPPQPQHTTPGSSSPWAASRRRSSTAGRSSIRRCAGWPCRPPACRSAAPGASTMATTKGCTPASIRPRCVRSAAGARAISSTSASGRSSSTPRWQPAARRRSPQELAARIRAHLSEAEFVELAAWVALENFRSRFNAGLGLRSQGFSDDCEIPMRAVTTDAVA